MSEDYTDYSLFYDALPTAPISWTMPATSSIPRSTSSARDHYTKISNELRVSSPKENRFRFDGGRVPAAPGARHSAGLLW